MSADMTIIIMAALCVAAIVIMAFHKQARLLLRAARNALIGGLGFFAANWIFGALGTGMFVGVNAMTLAFVGLLGIPGFISLYLISLFA